MTKHEPYWWEAAPPQSLPQHTVAATADVAIVGAGYTGLSAAITLAHAGRSVQVFDRIRPGEGASTRNGGIASGNLRPGRDELVRRFGVGRAEAILLEAKAAREDLAQFIATQSIDCDFRITGRFTGASKPADYERLAREADMLARDFGVEAHAVPKSEQRGALGTDYYSGGMVRMDIGGLHPAKLHREMMRVAAVAGATIHGETGVLAIGKEGTGFRVRTARGDLLAHDVIIGTNGYTDGVDPWLRRRLVPVASAIIATEPLSDNLMKVLMPRGFMCSETRKLHYYYRPSPDGRRILFGGRGASLKENKERIAARLKRAMADVFPEVADTPLSHVWSGYVAMNRDMVPRVFHRDGLHYAAGYCGSGVVWARWAGQKVALQVLGRSEGRTALDFRPPRLIPMYTGKPWFMPAVFAWLEAQDRLSRR